MTSTRIASLLPVRQLDVVLVRIFQKIGAAAGGNVHVATHRHVTSRSSRRRHRGDPMTDLTHEERLYLRCSTSTSRGTVLLQQPQQGRDIQRLAEVPGGSEESRGGLRIVDSGHQHYRDG